MYAYIVFSTHTRTSTPKLLFAMNVVTLVLVYSFYSYVLSLEARSFSLSLSLFPPLFRHSLTAVAVVLFLTLYTIP